jgi:hypothetical protein
MDRPISSLLKTQIEHLHAAERRLPLRYRSEIYPNAIKTEGEAAAYIREVTEAIHRAHEEAAARRERGKWKAEPGLQIAAVAEPPVSRRSRKSTKGNRKR